MADGRPASREIVEHPGAVGIVAWDGERMAMVRQWRQAAGRETPEILADPGIRARSRTRRRREPGGGVRGDRCHVGGRSRLLDRARSAPSTSLVWLATDLAPTSASGPEDESLSLEWLGLDQAMDAVASGVVSDAKSLVAISGSRAGWAAPRQGRGA